MAKMNKKWVALCSTAIGAIYAAGYFTTETQASIQQTPQALTYSQASAAAAQTADPDSAATPAPAATATPEPAVTVPAATAPVTQSVKAAPVPSAPAKVAPAPSTPARSATAPAVAAPTASAKAVPAPSAAAPSSGNGGQASSKYKNGTFHGTGSNRRGAIQVAVTIQNDKITDVEISRFAMHYSEDDVVGLPKEVLQLQNAQVRNVSGATYSTEAFKDAVNNALSQARNA